MFDVAFILLAAIWRDAAFAVTAQEPLLSKQGGLQGVFDGASESFPAR
jgi:hypothetical protein